MTQHKQQLKSLSTAKSHAKAGVLPDIAWVVLVVVCGSVLDLPEEPLHSTSIGERVVDVDVVVLPAGRLLHKGLLDLQP